MNRKRAGRIHIQGAYRLGWVLLFILLAFSLTTSAVHARDAAFLDPAAGNSSGAGDDAMRVEPKGDIDMGDSMLGVARRVDLFFVNQSALPVKIEKVAINGDGNVATEITSDDCSKQGTIPPGSRCAVEVSVTPSSPGGWSAQVLMTHDGSGRIARAKLSGKTGGSATGEKKDMGLALSTKEISPVNFGDVEIGGGKIVRSALMVNDSAEPITLYSIDVIEASNGLTRLDQGCAIDMELKPGESCPVTLVWTPGDPGQVSTDLIIRHSGRLGFAVIPIRGVAKGLADASKSGDGSKTAMGKNGIPNPPSAHDLEKAASGKIPAVPASVLGPAASGAVSSNGGGTITLIGTVGNRAVILKPDGKTAVVSAGEEIDVGDHGAKIVNVGPKSAEILIDGKKKTLVLEASQELIARASVLAKAKPKEELEVGSSSAAPGAASFPPLSATGAPSGGLGTGK